MKKTKEKSIKKPKKTSNKKSKKTSIKTRLTRTILITVIMPLLLISFVSVFYLRKISDSNFETNSSTLNKIAKNTINTEMNRYKDLINTYTEGNKDISNKNKFNNLKTDLKFINSTDNEIVSVYYANENKDMVHSTTDLFDDSFDPTSRDWYKVSKDYQVDVNIGEPYVDVVTYRHVITLSKAIVEDGVFKGVLALDVDLSTLSEQLTEIKYGDHGSITVFDEDGCVITSTKESLIGSDDGKNYSNWNSIMKNNTGTEIMDYSGESYACSYSTEDTTNWKIVIKTPVDEMKAQEHRIAVIILIILLIVIVLNSLLSTQIAKRITKEIKITVEAVIKVAKGIFNEKLTLNRTDEFNDLEVNYNLMLDNVSNLIKDVDNSTERVNGTSEKVALMSEEISDSMSMVSKTVDEIAEGTIESANNLQTISADLDALSSNMNNIENKIQSVDEMAVTTNKLGTDGMGIVKTLMEKSSQTKKSIEMLDSVVKGIAESVAHIGEMSDSISQITNQTNMLSLNASIEAARAGEAGKGFAVVADEIRALADQTSNAANRIDEIVKNINSITNNAVKDVNSTIEVVGTQETAVNESKAVFNEIINSVDTLASSVKEISDGINSINVMKNNVVDKVQNLSSIMEETAAGTQEVAASVTQVSNTTTEFAKDIDNLNTLSKELKDELSVFKVD